MSKDTQIAQLDAQAVEQAGHFITTCRTLMRPASRSGTRAQLRVFLLALAIALVPLATVIFGIGLFDARLNAIPATETPLQSANYGQLYKDVQAQLARACDDGTCPPEEAEAAKSALSGLLEAEARKSPRYKASRIFSGVIPTLLAVLVALVVCAVALIAQTNLTWRFWIWSIEGYRRQLPPDETSGNRVSVLTWQRFFLALLMPLAAGLACQIVLRTLGAQIDPLASWAASLLLAAMTCFALRAALNHPPATPFGSVLPPLLLGVTALCAFAIVDLALHFVPVMASFKGISTPLGWLTVMLAAVLVSMLCAISFWSAHVYREPFPSPSRANEMLHRAYGVSVKLRDIGLERLKLDPGRKGKDPNAGLWSAMKDWVKTHHNTLDVYPETLPVDPALRPNVLSGAATATALTFAVALIFVLVAMNAYGAWAIAGLNGGSASVKSALEEALRSYILLAGFGFTAAASFVYFYAQMRLYPFMSAESQLSKPPAQADPQSAPLQIILKTNEPGDGRYTLDLNGILAKRTDDTPTPSEAPDPAKEQLESKLAEHIGMDKTKFEILQRGSQIGGGLQAILKDKAKDQALAVLGLISPAAVSGFLALFS